MRIALHLFIARASYAVVILSLAGSCRPASETPAGPPPAARPESGPATRAAAAAVPRAVKMGEVVRVAAEPAGGFKAVSPSTDGIDLDWPAVPGADIYFVFRSDKPDITIGYYEATALRAQVDTNRHEDNEVEPGAGYYYAIVAVIGSDQARLVATGHATTLTVDGPLMPNENALPANAPK